MTIFALIANTIQFFIAILLLTELSSPWGDRDIFLIFVMLVVPALNLMCFLPVSEKRKDKAGFISMH
ncbi:hypothetical protein [Desulfoluna spongiiphila]|uniref:Uncharacterized protein n=1 Tax=Desulfoluna spongiiphila TaxID=419481 RepID=A0A1G5GC23_9BACT|nr:hypothetical protein [Desulfoluna spongiiphila]SCY49156.1 hypothetical protein SAMN05216233_11076 [Desulfoluna spongiiphila]VVS93644.1 hypothetical protein DBB_32160 [Desulfoluna spongiiphila]